MLCCSCERQTPLPSDPYFDDQRRLVATRPVGAQPWAVLELLRRRAARLVHRDIMLAHLPGSPSPRALDVYVCRLRQALIDTPHRIETVRGAGFILIRATDRDLARS